MTYTCSEEREKAMHDDAAVTMMHAQSTPHGANGRRVPDVACLVSHLLEQRQQAAVVDADAALQQGQDGLNLGQLAVVIAQGVDRVAEHLQAQQHNIRWRWPIGKMIAATGTIGGGCWALHDGARAWEYLTCSIRAFSSAEVRSSLAICSAYVSHSRLENENTITGSYLQATGQQGQWLIEYNNNV